MCPGFPGGATQDGGEADVVCLLGDRLVLWLDARQVNPVLTAGPGNLVTTWFDQSAYGNHAHTTGDGGLPAFEANSQPGGAALHFGKDGGATRLMVADHPTLAFGVNDVLVAAVVAYSNDPTWPNDSRPGQVLSKQRRSSPYPGIGLWGNDVITPTARFRLQQSYPTGAVLTAGSSYNDERWHVVMGLRHGNMMQVNADRESSLPVNTGVTADLTVPGEEMGIGGSHFSPNYMLRGWLAEVLVVSGETTVEERGLLRDALLRRYAIP